MTYIPKIDWSRPTAQMLGRFDPWTESHRMMFKEILLRGDPTNPRKTSSAHQVLIMVRHNERFDEIFENIKNSLEPEFWGRYEVMQVPDITNIFFGRHAKVDVDRINLSEKYEPAPETPLKIETNAIWKRFWAGRQ